MRMRTLIPLGIVLGLAVLFPACDSSSPLQPPGLDGSDSTPGELMGPTWHLTSLQTPAGTQYSPDQLTGRHDGNEAYTLQFKEGKTLGGTADCNSYGGDYAAEDGGVISVDSLGTTLVGCGEDSREGLYLNALGAVEAYSVEEGQLRLGYDQRGVLAFTRQ